MRLLETFVARLRSLRLRLRRRPGPARQLLLRPGAEAQSRGQAAVNLSREQFRELLMEALDNPATARLVARRLLLPVLPLRGASDDPVTSSGGTTNYVAKFTGTLAIGNSTIFDSGGNVGIGTTTPTAPLHIKSNATASSYGSVYLDTTSPGGHSWGIGEISGVGILSVRDLTASGAPIRFSIDTGGNVGIGTTSPAAKLDVAGGINASGSVGLGVTAPSYILDVKAKSAVGAASFTGSGLNDMTSGGTFLGASALNYKVQIDGTGTPNTFKWSDNGGASWNATGVPITGGAQTLNDGVTVTFGATTGHTSGDYWTFSTTVTNPFSLQNAAGTRTLCANNDGSLILGGTLPKQASGGPEMISFQNSDPDHVAFAGFVGSETNFRFGASLRGFMEWGPGGSSDQDVALFRNWAGGLAVQSFNGTSSDHAFAVQKPTTDGSVGADLFRVNTTSNAVLVLGNPGVGTSAPSNTLEVAAGGTTLADAWTTRSCLAAKANVRALDGAMPRVERLRGVSFEWKSSGKPGLGLMAEEVAAVVPEAVSYTSGGSHAEGVDYGSLVALLVEAIKEQEKRIQVLGAEISDLRKTSSR